MEAMASKIMTRRRERSRRRLVKVRIVRSVALRWGGAAMVRGRQGRERRCKMTVAKEVF
jgi:hypothetical protein